MTSSMAAKSEHHNGITCGLCFDVFKYPLTFDCHHSYCSECVRSKIESLHGSGFACPLCNFFHPNVSLSNLQNFADTGIASHVKMMADGAEGKLLCQWCEEVSATFQCHECMFVYCNECNAAVHKSAAKRGHVTAKIGDQSTLRGIRKKCSVRGHEEYRAEFYCSECEDMCCAYCLQVGPHKNHENVVIARAAAEIRQRISRDMNSITETKVRLERQATELNRVTAQYFISYDTVENIITERFTHFRQQLMQREVDLRKTLTALRESGDASLTSARKFFLTKINALNEASLRFQRVQHGGADYEVLESRSNLHSYLNTEVPAVSGTGFKVADIGDVVIPGLNIVLDLQTGHNVEHNGIDATYQIMADAPPPSGLSTRQPSEFKNEARRSNGVLPLGVPLRLTFPIDKDVEAIVKGDGVLLSCVARREEASTQIGVRSKETMESVSRMFPEDGGFITWRVRLENIVDSFLGVVEKTESATVPEGFYWRPSACGVTDGRIGRQSSLVQRLPVCRRGEVVCFTYDMTHGTLRVRVNDTDHGIIVTDLHPRIAACFIFYPGESLTVLF